MYNRLLPSWRHVVFIVLLVVLGLVVISNAMQPMMTAEDDRIAEYVEKELRVPPWDAVVYTPMYVDRFARAEKEKPVIGFFGPSTVYGTTVMKGANTVAGVVQAARPDTQVVNFGLTGARFTETYALLQAVVDRVDVAMIELNYGMVMESENADDILVYPALFKRLGSYIPKEWLEDFPEKNSAAIPTGVHQWFSENVLNKWNLYRERESIVYQQYKTRTVMSKLQREYQNWLNDHMGIAAGATADLYAPYEKQKPEVQNKIVEHFRDLYAWEQPFRADHSFGLMLIEQTLKLLKEHGKSAIVYSAPLDYDFISSKGLIDWRTYNDVMGHYRKLVESYGFRYVEFNQPGSDGNPSAGNLVDHSFYHDPSHLLDKGNHKFGDILYDTVKTDLSQMLEHGGK